MLVICLSRVGKKKQPDFRVIVSEKGKDPWGKVKEFVGFVSKRTNPKKINLKKDRIEYWISKGAQPSDTLYNLFVDQGIIKNKKQTTIKISRRRAVKLADKKKKAEESAAKQA